MAARVTMGDLLDRLRMLINDPVGASSVFEPEALQQFLDAHRIDVIQYPLKYVSSIMPDGAVETHTFYMGVGDWESGATITDSGGAVVAPDAEDAIVGRWDFVDDTDPPLYITGGYYDLYAAAADALEARAGMVALQYDFSADGATYNRSQQMQALLALARQYRGMARPTVVRMVRSDL